MLIVFYLRTLIGCSALAAPPAPVVPCSVFLVPRSSGAWAADLAQLSADPDVEPPSYFQWEVRSIELPPGWAPVGGGWAGKDLGAVVACRGAHAQR